VVGYLWAAPGPGALAVAVAALIGTQASVVLGGFGCVAGIAVVARFMPRFVGYRITGGGGSPGR